MNGWVRYYEHWYSRSSQRWFWQHNFGLFGIFINSCLRYCTCLCSFQLEHVHVGFQVMKAPSMVAVPCLWFVFFFSIIFWPHTLFPVYFPFPFCGLFVFLHGSIPYLHPCFQGVFSTMPGFDFQLLLYQFAVLRYPYVAGMDASLLSFLMRLPRSMDGQTIGCFFDKASCTYFSRLVIVLPSCHCASVLFEAAVIASEDTSSFEVWGFPL